MSERLTAILDKIREERQRQFDLPGSEWDSKNRPGEWVALVTHYVGEEVRRNGITPDRGAFEDSLVKAAAVIIAAIDHLDIMESRGELR